MLSMVLALSGSAVGRNYLSHQSGLLADIVTLLHTGSARVQRQVKYAHITIILLPIFSLKCVTINTRVDIKRIGGYKNIWENLCKMVVEFGFLAVLSSRKK